MFESILVPIDLADTDHLAKSAVSAATALANTRKGAVRLLYVLPMKPAMLAEDVPADFDTHSARLRKKPSPSWRVNPASSRRGFLLWYGKAASTTRFSRKPPPSAPSREYV